MATVRELFEFTEDGCEPVEQWLEVAVDRGRGEWVNLEPVVDDESIEQLAVRRGVAGWMSGRGSDLPFATIVAPLRERKVVPASLGIQHGAGPRADQALRAAGIGAPAVWTRRQDHPRRGLVYELDPDTAPGDVLRFVFAAVRHLCPVPLDGRWSAVTHRLD